MTTPGAGLATLAVGGALLTLGLTQRWGEVYPRWVPFLRGKPVRPRTAIIPATVVAILVTSAGMAYLRAMLTGQVSLDWGSGPRTPVAGVGSCPGRRHSRLPPAPPRPLPPLPSIMNWKPPCRLLAAISSLGWGGVVPPTSSMSVVRLSPLPQNSNKRRDAFPDQLPPVEGSPLVRLPGADITQNAGAL